MITVWRIHWIFSPGCCKILLYQRKTAPTSCRGETTVKHNAPAALLLSAILLLQGCAAVPAEKTAPTAAPEPAAEPEVSAELPESVPADSRIERLRVISEYPRGMDAPCFAEVYETLYAVQAGETVPVLAAAAWELSEDGRCYRMALLPDVTDSEGNPFTAADAARCYGQMLGGLLVSAEVDEDGALLLRFRRKLREREERYWLCEQPLYTAVGEVGEDGGLLECFGTGPYRLAEQGRDSLLLLPNEHWRGAAEDTQRTASIEYLFMNDAPSRVIALELGRAEMADCLSYEEAEDFLPGGSYSDLFTTVDYFSPVGRFLLPNMNKGSVLADEKVRLAVFSALDREALAEKLGGRACRGLGNPDYPELNTDSGFRNTPTDDESVYNALRDSGYRSENLTLLCPESGAGRTVAAQLQRLWERRGVSVILRPASPEEYEAALADGNGWDAALVETPAACSPALQWQALWAADGSTNVLRGGQSDAALLNLLRTLAKPETDTEENLQRLQELALSHGYALALPQLSEPRVVSVSINQAVMNGQGALLPGACEYKEGESNG